MTEMQSDFEDWLKKFNGGSLASMPAALEYVAWQAWQASRAAVVVKLPLFCVDGVDAAEYRDDVIEALDEAGVSYE